jgi:hypothetical protein
MVVILIEMATLATASFTAIRHAQFSKLCNISFRTSTSFERGTL